MNKKAKIVCGIIVVVLMIGLVWQWRQMEALEARYHDYDFLNIEWQLADQKFKAEQEGHQKSKEQISELEKDIEALKEENNTLKYGNDLQIAKIKALPIPLNQNSIWALEDKVGTELDFIVEDLLTKDDVIGKPGILGGTMQFTEAFLLTDRLVLGAFEDGHAMGTGIYEFYLDDEGNLQWEVKLEQMDGESWWPKEVDTSDEWAVWEQALYKSRTLEEVIDLYNDKIDASYADSYGNRLLRFYQDLGPNQFAEVMVHSGSDNLKEIEVLLIGQVQIYGDIFELTLDQMILDLEAEIQPEKDAYIRKLVNHIKALQEVYQ